MSEESEESEVRDEAAHREKMARIKAAKDRLYASKTKEKGLPSSIPGRARARARPPGASPCAASATA
jgi:hypothetical protein